jgi:hypothetical protein
MAHLAAHGVLICAAIRAISIAYGASDAPFRPTSDERTRERTQETSERTRDSDERTQQNSERTREPANEPDLPGCRGFGEKPFSVNMLTKLLKIVSQAAGRSPNPSFLETSNEPGRRLTAGVN